MLNKKKRNESQKNIAKNKSFSKEIEILNYKPAAYVESEAWITYQNEILEKAAVMKCSKADDLCEDMFNADIDAHALNEKEKAKKQKLHHMEILQHNYGIAKGQIRQTVDEKKDLEQKKEELKMAKNLPVSLFCSNKIVTGLVILFCITDAFSVFSGIDTIITASPVISAFLALVAAAILDVPASVAGNIYKQYLSGVGRSLQEVRIIVITAILAFIIIFGAVFAVRMVNMEKVNDTGSDIVNNVSESEDQSDQTGSPMITDQNKVEDGTSTSNFVGALFLGILPLATSLASFVITFSVADPAQERKDKICRIEHEICLKNKALVEAGQIQEFYKNEIEREESEYNTFLLQIDRTALCLKEQVILLFMYEKALSASAISRLAQAGKKLIPNFDPETHMQYKNQCLLALEN